MHKCCLDLQQMKKHSKRIWGEYYILKMDVAKFFQNIDKDILLKILLRKIKDENLIWLTKERKTYQLEIILHKFLQIYI